MEIRKIFVEPVIHKTLQVFGKTRKNRNGSVVMNVMSDLYLGVTLAIFNSDGTEPEAKERLKI